MSVFKLFHRGRFPKLPTFRPLACRVPNHEGSLTHHCEPAPACAAWSLGALRWLASWPEHPLRVVPSLLIGGAQLIEPTDGRKRTSATLDARFLVFMFLFFSFPESNQAWYQLSASRTCRSSRLSEPLEHLSALSSKSAQSPLAGCRCRTSASHCRFVPGRLSLASGHVGSLSPSRQAWLQGIIPWPSKLASSACVQMTTLMSKFPARSEVTLSVLGRAGGLVARASHSLTRAARNRRLQTLTMTMKLLITTTFHLVIRQTLRSTWYRLGKVNYTEFRR